ncbi:MAG: trehalose-phosphatase [Candidatus Limnocylindrales bacterium]
MTRATPEASEAAEASDTPRTSSRAAIDAAITRLASARAPLLVVVDFDGTLSVGSRDPAVARVEPAAQRALRHLARLAAARPGRVHVVVLTGRTVADVAERVRVGGIEYLGDHGLQHATLPRGGRASSAGARMVTETRFDRHRDPAETLATGVATELGTPAWLFVERKGPSVAFHVRQADDVVAARAAVVLAVKAVEAREGLSDHGLAHYRGRSVVDLRPVDAGGKREAVDQLLARHRVGGVVVLGDELSDVDAFEAVVAARLTDPELVGVGVAIHATPRPAPPELLAVADLALGSPTRVGPFLVGLARAIGRQ